MSTLSVGDRVERGLLGDEFRVVGVVKSIQLTSSPEGFVPILQVQVDGEDQELTSPAHLWRLWGGDEAVEDSDAKDDVCDECGQAHDGPFTPELLDLFNRVGTTGDSHERQLLLVELAETFAGNLDQTDLGTPEGIHQLVTNAFSAVRRSEQAWLVLGREIARVIAATNQAANQPPLGMLLQQIAQGRSGPFDNN